MQEYRYVRLLEQVGKEDLSLVGGKGANLGEMIRAGLDCHEAGGRQQVYRWRYPGGHVHGSLLVSAVFKLVSNILLIIAS